MGERRDNSTYTDPRTLGAARDEAAEVLSSRTAQMDSRQKALLWMVLNQGASYQQVARLSGEHASTVSRRFRAMVRRLRGRPRRPAEPSPDTLTGLEKTILIESFLYGTGQKQIAAKLGVSRYRVRKALAYFQGNRQPRSTRCLSSK